MKNILLCLILLVGFWGMVNAQHIKTIPKENLKIENLPNKVWIIARIRSDFTACSLTLAANGKKYETKGISHYERINDRESLKRDLVYGENEYRIWELDFKKKPIYAMFVVSYIFTGRGYTIKEFPIENSSKMSYMGFNNCRFLITRPGLYYIGDVAVLGSFSQDNRWAQIHYKYRLSVDVESDVKSALSFFYDEYGFMPDNTGYANYWTVKEVRSPFKLFYNGYFPAKEPKSMNALFYVPAVRGNDNLRKPLSYREFHSNFVPLNLKRSRKNLTDKQKLAIELLEKLPDEKVAEICEGWAKNANKEDMAAFALFLRKCDKNKVAKSLNLMDIDLMASALVRLKTELQLECVSYLTEGNYTQLAPKLSMLNF